MKKMCKFLFAGCLLAMFMTAGNLFAQSGLNSIVDLSSKGKKGKNTQPTVITSDSMSIDLPKNQAVFTGNVEIDGDQMNIKCHKMTIYLRDKPKGAKGSDGEEEPDTAEGKIKSASKEVYRIICEGNVIITRKGLDKEEQAKGEQKATCGHAVYNFITGDIVMTQKPIISRGKDKIIGRIITINRDTEKMDVSGGRIVVSPKTANGGMRNMRGSNDRNIRRDRSDRKVDDVLREQ